MENKTDNESLALLARMFKAKWGITLNTYEDLYSRTDCWFEWDTKSYDVEVKRRRFNSNKYPTTIINYDKYKELVKRNAILVIMFDDCWYICKNVRKAYLKTTPMYARHTTDWVGEWEWSNKVELDLNKFDKYDYVRVD